MNTPNIRFKGFMDAWEQLKLSELTTMHARIGWQNLRTSEFLDSGDYMLITGTDFDDGKINFSNCHYVERERYDQDKHIQISNGSILITKDGTLGKVAYVEGLPMPATLNAGVFNVEIIDDKEIDRKYLFQYLKAPFLMDYVKQRATGGTIKHLNQNILVDFPVATPKKNEQEKIGEFLSSIDNLITLHQRKSDSLKQVKKYMLQKMFPKQGEKVPEIRFAVFTDDWEQRKLGELGNFKNGMNFSKDAMDKGYPFVNLQNIFGKNVIDIDNLGLADASDKQLKEYNLQEGDVLFVRSSVKLEGVGEAAIVPKRLENTTYSGFVIRFRDESNMDTNYKRFVFGTNSIRNQIMAKATNSANKNISQDVLINLEICVPSKEEQRKIGKYFVNLDNLITLHQRKSDSLKEIKKFMLQNMFPRE
ncbi:restriction endonuclease subunit S [Anaerovibrio lipolyticus]|uniref:restriction endonuclease subunit S n=1 Tax=Anaerovibrio lipolyticus TaxID=82374 RepID=UPI0025EFAE00|nr:restriction endonuclease subunit S [Anaerovibrio lipolyticus]